MINTIVIVLIAIVAAILGYAMTRPDTFTVKRAISIKAPPGGHNTATFLLEPKGELTDVTWTMDGPSPYVAKVMGVFMNMDKMIGNDFEAGLADMKATAEK